MREFAARVSALGTGTGVRSTCGQAIDTSSKEGEDGPFFTDG